MFDGCRDGDGKLSIDEFVSHAKSVPHGFKSSLMLDKKAHGAQLAFWKATPAPPEMAADMEKEEEEEEHHLETQAELKRDKVPFNARMDDKVDEFCNRLETFQAELDAVKAAVNRVLDHHGVEETTLAEQLATEEC